jgi:hypothetical protein
MAKGKVLCLPVEQPFCPHSFIYSGNIAHDTEGLVLQIYLGGRTRNIKWILEGTISL